MEALKNEKIPRPFTTEKKIRDYLELEQDGKFKSSRLYNACRYARVNSISLKTTAVFFRLKQNYQNFTPTEYAENLISYLNSARCCKRVTVDDLYNITHGKARRMDVVETVVDKESVTGER